MAGKGAPKVVPQQKDRTGNGPGWLFCHEAREERASLVLAPSPTAAGPHSRAQPSPAAGDQREEMSNIKIKTLLVKNEKKNKNQLKRKQQKKLPTKSKQTNTKNKITPKKLKYSQ